MAQRRCVKVPVERCKVVKVEVPKEMCETRDKVECFQVPRQSCEGMTRSQHQSHVTRILASDWLRVIT